MPNRRASALYHSELCKACKDGPIELEFKTGPMPSKFRGKPPYCIVHYNGEDRAYNLDSEACEQFAEFYKEKGFVAVIADGRDDQATLSDHDGGEPAQAAPRATREEPSADPNWNPEPPEDEAALQRSGMAAQTSRRAQPQSRTATAPQRRTAPSAASSIDKEQKAVNDGFKFAAAMANGLRICRRKIRAMHEDEVREDPQTPPMAVEDERALVVTLFIEGCKRGQWDDLPWKPLDNYMPEISQKRQ